MNFIQIRIHNHIGFITLNRPKALNSLSLEMIRDITQTLRDWKDADDVQAVFIHSDHERAFCAGGDIRFFYEMGSTNSALLEDFFTEEYLLNHLIHHYPKPYISLLDGVVMGGGMGIGQGSLRIVTDRTKMAMPEVNIGLFPDVGGSYFLPRCAGEIGTYLGVSGETIHASDAIYADLADIYLPGEQVASLINYIERADQSDLNDIDAHIHNFAKPYQSQLPKSHLAQHRSAIDHCFSHHNVTRICAALNADSSPFAKHTLQTIETRSPLMMCVTLELLRRGKNLSLAECLRMERTMVRHCFQHGEVVEGIRALVIDKDMRPQWRPAKLEEVSSEMVDHFFEPVWPDYAHPLRNLKSEI